MLGGTENSQENTSTIDLYRLNVAFFVAFVYTEAQEQIDARELDVLTAVHQRRLQSFRALHPSAGAATPQRCAESGQALRADLDRMAQIHHERLDRLRPADPAQAQRRVRIDADLEQLEARRAATDREIIATRLAAEEARDSRRFDDLCADILHRLEDLPGTLRPGASIDSDDTLRAALADIDAALDRCLRLHQGRIERVKDLDPHLRLGWLGPTAAACIADLTRDLATLRACRHLVTGGATGRSGFDRAAERRPVDCHRTGGRCLDRRHHKTGSVDCGAVLPRGHPSHGPFRRGSVRRTVQ